MTDDTVTTDVVASDDESTDERPFSEQVREFQLMFAHELHRLADVAGACTTFDSLMNDWGMPARYRHQRAEDGRYNEYGYNYGGNEVLTDIVTPHAASEWLRRVARDMTAATRSYGYSVIYEHDGTPVRLPEVLAKWGFPTRTEETIRIVGTFDVAMVVQRWSDEDANLIDDVEAAGGSYQVGNIVRSAIELGNESVQWKAQLPEG